MSDLRELRDALIDALTNTIKLDLSLKKVDEIKAKMNEKEKRK